MEIYSNHRKDDCDQTNARCHYMEINTDYDVTLDIIAMLVLSSTAPNQGLG